MALVINTNIASMNARRNLDSNQSQLAVSLQRLSSGLRVNSARDDAAGLAISERMTTQIRGMSQSRRNINDAISMVQTSEAALGEMTSLFQRGRELAVQAANASNSASDKTALQAEMSQLIAEVDRISSSAEFNSVKLFDGGSRAAQLRYQQRRSECRAAGNCRFSAKHLAGPGRRHDRAIFRH